MKSAALLKMFVIVAIIYLIMLFLGVELAWFLKALLLPVLLAAVAASKKFPSKNLLVSALLFSWFGDIALMAENKADKFFYIGAGLFVIAHLLYVLLFLKQQKWNRPGNYYVVLGAFFLIIADILIGVDHFSPTAGLAQFNIMTAYLAAQFLLVFGILTLNRVHFNLEETP